jgi:hypothetical protein
MNMALLGHDSGYTSYILEFDGAMGVLYTQQGAAGSLA